MSPTLSAMVKMSLHGNGSSRYFEYMIVGVRKGYEVCDGIHHSELSSMSFKFSQKLASSYPWTPLKEVV